MATTNTSGLVENTDFAAELLLNKIMNGQYRTTNNNTVTMGGRINAAHLNAASRVNNADAANVARNRTIVDATQNALTEILDLAQRAYAESSANSDATYLSKMGTEFSTELQELLKVTLDSNAVLSAAVPIGLGAGAGTIAGGVNLTADAGYAALTAAIGAMTAGSQGAASNFESAINSLLALVATTGAQANLLKNRYDMLNDLSQSYHTASDNQVVTQGGNATSLLNALL